jgi:hypothetical protein
MTVSIADDFAAIRARLVELQAARRGAAGTASPDPAAAANTPGPVTGTQTQHADFYGWLMGGGLWTPG